MTFFDLHVGLPEVYSLGVSGISSEVSSCDWEQLLDDSGASSIALRTLPPPSRRRQRPVDGTCRECHPGSSGGVLTFVDTTEAVRRQPDRVRCAWVLAIAATGYHREFSMS
jgi:hypothetical protein